VGLDSPWWALPVLAMRAEDGLLWRQAEAPAASWPAGESNQPAVAGDVIIAEVSGQAHHVVVGKDNVQAARAQWLPRVRGTRWR
jgi:hypothetical protein